MSYGHAQAPAGARSCIVGHEAMAMSGECKRNRSSIRTPRLPSAAAGELHQEDML